MYKDQWLELPEGIRRTLVVRGNIGRLKSWERVDFIGVSTKKEYVFVRLADGERLVVEPQGAKTAKVKFSRLPDDNNPGKYGIRVSLPSARKGVVTLKVRQMKGKDSVVTLQTVGEDFIVEMFQTGGWSEKEIEVIKEMVEEALAE